MKKILFYSLLLFWWCLMFPSSSYTNEHVNETSALNKHSVIINNNEVRFRILDFLF